ITLLGGIANHLGTSPLLANMALGFYMTNDLRVPRTAFNVIDEIEPTLFVVFFTLAGAHLELRNLLHGTLIIFLYIILRLLGKAIGVMTGGAASNAPKTVRKYLALGLAPQAGVAIGLALLLNQEAHFSGQGRFIIDVIIGSTVIYELTGPLLAKLALTKAGEVKENA
ncbi:MAG: cation:proton antiporter, partial [Candidatus Hydrothermae bacterium]|nr:cation:proton antiporter [Candidatus Hydrothermae bacterium]